MTSRAAIEADIGIALIVGKDQQDVGALVRGSGTCEQDPKESEDQPQWLLEHHPFPAARQGFMWCSNFSRPGSSIRASSACSNPAR